VRPPEGGEAVEEAVSGRRRTPEERWAISSLFLVVTSACNLRCAYCYNSRRSPRRMDWPTAEAAVARLWSSGERDVRLLVTGGEPLLEFAFIQRLVELVRASRPRGRTAEIHLLTNGTRLDDERVAFFARHRVHVQISLDGVEPAQRLRGAWTVGRLDAVVSQIRKRHRSWFESRVNAAVTLVPAAVPCLADSFDHLLGRGFRDISLTPASGGIHGWREDMVPLLDEQFRRVYRSSLDHYRRTGRVPLSLFRKGRPSPYPPWSSRCGVETGCTPAVDVDGSVYGCPPVVGSALDEPRGLLQAASDALRIGDIRDPGLADRLPAYRRALARTGLFGRRDRTRSGFGRCRACACLGHCNLCPLSVALAPGASDPRLVPDFACAFTRVSLKYRHRFPRQPDRHTQMTAAS